MNVSKSDIDTCRQKDEWTLGNSILYDLCSKYPLHNKADEIIAKIWIIGRTYAAAIERRKAIEAAFVGDKYYTHNVVPKILNSELDKYINELRNVPPFSESSISQSLQTHKYLTNLFKSISESGKRSLASKYLHFHLPNHFFIFDSRAQIGLSRIEPNKRINYHQNRKYDNQYAKFYLKLIDLRNAIYKEFKISLSPREIDKLLLLNADKNNE
jgi:hypothetical protein